MSRLEARGVTKRYGAVLALDDVSVELRAGEVHALMGENGAGKSTLSRIIAGVASADSGEILLDGEPVRFDGPLAAQARGVAIIFQELDLFPHLSVAENIVVGNLRFRERFATDPAAAAAFSRPFLDQVGLTVDPRAPVATLPIAHQQLVAIARALSMNCRVLLMDEPTSALSDDAAERLFEVIAALKRDGVAIAYVSHKMDEIFRLCDRITVLRDGRLIGTRPTAEVDRAELIAMMVGRAVDLSTRKTRDRFGPVLLAAEGVTTRKLQDVSFELRRGEVLGVAGLVGAGRSELGAALVGLDPILGGGFALSGEAYRPKGPADAQTRGVALLPEDRKLQGLMLQMSVGENAGMATLGASSRMGFLDRARERLALKPVAERLALKCASTEARISSLSGGNQQKALLARWLLAEPDVLFLDDPARGVDVGAKEDIYRIIDELAEAGRGVLLASSELPELLRCADRIMVLAEGRVTGMFDAAAATQENIMAAATHFSPARAA